MVNHDKVKKFSEAMISNLEQMEELVTKFKPKTDNYDANIGDDISAAAKTLMDDIITTLKSFRKEVSEKTSGVRNFAKKLGDSERKQTGRIGAING